MSLTAEEIKKASKAKLQVKKISTPEWSDVGTKNGHVYVRAVSALSISLMQRIRELPMFAKDENAAGIVAWCVACISDKNGVLLFDETDCEWLASDPIDPVMRCCTAAQALNGSDKETAGNLKEGQSEGSP